MRLIKKGKLSKQPRFSFLESRGALWVEIDFHGSSVQIINTHLGLNKKERLLHSKELLGQQWLKNSRCAEPIILCGDFNALPGSRVLNLFQNTLVNVQMQTGRIRHRRTWFGRFPFVCLDYIFITPDFEVNQVEVGDSVLARLASDHRPLFAEIKIQH
jgi:endonuclease/exonuclease/phosphatase family metal-dependent hydrolase